MKDDAFIEIKYPSVRTFTADTGRISRDKHYVRALLEVDVSDALQKLRQMRAPGKKVSLQAWFIKVLADAVALHPPINGVHKGRDTVLAARSVNVSTVVEKTVDGTSVPLPLVLRGANTKTVLQLSDEIQAAVTQTVDDESDYVLGKGEDTLLLRLAVMMPQWLRLFIMRSFILNNPKRVQEMMGTVMVTSLGTVGRLSGWIIPASMHPLSIGIGSLNKKPAVYKGEITKRDILHVTIAFDHDVIDGMPALKFVDALVAGLEAGEGLG